MQKEPSTFRQYVEALNNALDEHPSWADRAVMLRVDEDHCIVLPQVKPHGGHVVLIQYLPVPDSEERKDS